MGIFSIGNIDVYGLKTGHSLRSVATYGRKSGHLFTLYADNLRSLVEHTAIEYKLIEKVVDIPLFAWGAPGQVPWYPRNTNLNPEELDIFSEQVHFLLYQNVISPGAYGNYGNSLPYFHVTKYGQECLANQDILPYDPDKYLSRLKAIASIDAWELFYIDQAQLCYNTGALEASIIMLGLAGELLANKLINEMTLFLLKNETNLHLPFTKAISACNGKISQEYTVYDNSLASIIKLKDANLNLKYPILKSMQSSLDGSAKNIYATYLRLTRNELAHPKDVKMDRLECLALFSGYIRYCETQHRYIDFYNAHS